MRRLRSYSPGAEDWAWHVLLPFITYLTLAASAVAVYAWLELAIVGPAAVSLVLLFIGIHNAWDVAVFLVIQGGNERAETPAVPESGAAEGAAPPEPGRS